MKSNKQTNNTYNLTPLTVQTADPGSSNGGGSTPLTNNPGNSTTTAFSQKGVTDNFIQKGGVEVTDLPDSFFDITQFSVTDFNTPNEVWHIKSSYLTSFLDSYFSTKAGANNGDASYFFTAAGTFVQVSGTTPPSSTYQVVDWSPNSFVTDSGDGTLTRTNGGYNFDAVSHSAKKNGTIIAMGIVYSFKFILNTSDGEYYIGVNNSGTPSTSPQTDFAVSYHVNGNTGIRLHGSIKNFPYGNYTVFSNGQVAQIDFYDDGGVICLVNNVQVDSLPAGSIDVSGYYLEVGLYTNAAKVRLAQELFTASLNNY